MTGGQVRVHKGEAAKRDLVGHFVFLAEQAGLATAERFLTRADESFDDLGRRPLIGSIVELRRVELADIRKWRVKEFETFLIFYVPMKDRVHIVRVIHASQDWLAML